MARTAEELLEQYRVSHRERAEHGSFSGDSLRHYAGDIARVVDWEKATSLIDWGCGRGCTWTKKFMEQFPGVQTIGLYDPCVPWLSVKPTRQYDLLICTDVLEHILPQDIPGALQDMLSHCKAAFFGIPCYPARFMLPDGTQPHVSVYPPDYWQILLAGAAEEAGKNVYATFRMRWIAPPKDPTKRLGVTCQHLGVWYWEPGRREELSQVVSENYAREMIL